MRELLVADMRAAVTRMADQLVEDAVGELVGPRYARKDLSESPAARSLREGLEETLTVHRLGVTGPLRRTLQTTNPLESIFATVREKAARVKHGATAAWRCDGAAARS